MTKRAGIDPKKYERARVAFVTGGAATITQAARLVKLDISSLNKRAKLEDWRTQRTSHLAQIAEEIQKAEQAKIVRVVAETRETAWEVAQRALRSVNERMQLAEGDPERYVPTAAEAAILVKTAIALDHARTSLDPSTTKEARDSADMIFTAFGFGRSVRGLQAIVDGKLAPQQQGSSTS